MKTLEIWINNSRAYTLKNSTSLQSVSCFLLSRYLENVKITEIRFYPETQKGCLFGIKQEWTY